MYCNKPFGATGPGPGPGCLLGCAPSTRRPQAFFQRSVRPGRRSRLHPGLLQAQQDYSDSFVKRGRRQQNEKDEADDGSRSGLDLGSVFRNVFAPKAPAAATGVGVAATSAAAAGAAAFPYRAAAASSQYETAAAVEPAAFTTATAAQVPPPGPFSAAQMVAAASSATAAGGPGMDSLAQQVLGGHGAIQDDPVAAARQLQMFLSQYRDQYGAETNGRINAAVAKLQDYIDGYKAGTGGVAGADALGGLAAAAAAGGGDAAGSGGEGVVYHNYILEQLTGVLDWVNNLLVSSKTKPFVFDAYGRVLEDPNAAVNVEQQQEQLRAASNSLRLLIQQLQQVNRQYAGMADPDEKAAMGQVLQQLTTMADRLAVAANRRPLPPPMGGAGGAAADAAAAAAAAGTDLAPFVRPEQVYGVEKYRDPLLRVLDGIYHAVVVDSGLREFLSGIKQLGDSLVASMAVAWTGAPPLGRLIAYIAAVAGVVFVMRTRLPPSLLEPTSKFFEPTTKFFERLSIGAGGTGSGGAGAAAGGSGSDNSGSGGAAASARPGPTPAAPAAGSVQNPAAAAAFAAIASNSSGTSDGPSTAAAAAAAFAAIAANGGGGGSASGGQGSAGPLAELDRDWGVGDSRLPSEFALSNDPYAANRVLVEAQATPVAVGSQMGAAGSSSSSGGSGQASQQRRGGNGMGNGWATLTGGASAPTASPSPAAPAAAGASGGLFTSASFPTNMPKPPPGGWSGQYSDRADWWTLGQQQQQGQGQQQPQPGQPQPTYGTPLSPDGAAADPLRPRTVAESWEAFRRSTDGSIGGGSGVLDTTAALAAAAVAAAVGPAAAAAADSKTAEVARAAEEKRLSRDKARLRSTIKDRLRWVCLALGPVSSVVPGGEPLRDEVDGLLVQLEALSPTDKPLNTVVDVSRRTTVGPPAPLVDPLLLGDWRLVYASNATGGAGGPSAASQAASGGPNLLAQLLHLADSIPGFGMTQVVQRLTLEDGTPLGGASGSANSAGGFLGGAAGRFTNTGPSSPSSSPPSTAAPYGSRPVSGSAAGPAPSPFPSSSTATASSKAKSATILTENSAVFRFGPLGSWRVAVRGRWIDNGGGLCAAAEFESFSVRPVDLWGLPVEQLLPEVVVPVPEVLRSRSEWCTTYLDEDMRIGRGSGGALFLFKRGASDTETVAAAVAGGVGVQRPGAAAAVPPPPPAVTPRAPPQPAPGRPAAVPSGAGGSSQPVMRPL